MLLQQSEHREDGPVNGETAWNFSPNNPYQEDTSHVRPWEPPAPVVLTLRDLDQMVAARLDDERRRWAEEKRQACAAAWERGRSYGAENARISAGNYARMQVEEVINRRLNHIVRRLRERPDRAKSTIADERKFIEREHQELKHAIDALYEAVPEAR